MKNQHDNQSPETPAHPTPKTRGRPKTGNALTPAQKQAAYRARKATTLAMKGVPVPTPDLEALQERILALEQRVRDQSHEITYLALENDRLVKENRQLTDDIDILRISSKKLSKPSDSGRVTRKFFKISKDSGDSFRPWAVRSVSSGLLDKSFKRKADAVEYLNTYPAC